MSYKVDNVELYSEIYNYHEDLRHNPEARISDKLGKMIHTIALGMVARPNFSGYSFKDEFVSLGVYYALKYLKNYKLERKNSHAWVSKVVENAAISVINDEKKKLYVKYKSQLNSDSIMNMSDETNSQILKGTAGDFTKIEGFVNDFENSKGYKK